jgi:hypothetical protein
MSDQVAGTKTKPEMATAGFTPAKRFAQLWGSPDGSTV